MFGRTAFHDTIKANRQDSTCSTMATRNLVISLRRETKAASNVRQVISDLRAQIPLLIERAVDNVKAQLRKDISVLTWQEF
jgi:hypothetical protein